MKKLLSVICVLVIALSAMTVLASAAEGDVVLFEGEKLLETSWNWDGCPLDFANAGDVIVGGSKLTVTYTGTKTDAVYVVLEAPTLWVEGSENHYVQLDNASSCTDNGDGSYTSTFTYEQLTAANAEKNVDFSKVEKLRVGGNNDGAGITITNVTWCAPASAEPEATGFTAVKVGAGKTITVDGVKDAAYDDAQPLTVDHMMPWGAKLDQAEATVYVMWDEGFLYVFAEVTDPTHYGWEEGAWTEWNDCFEMYIDLKHDTSYTGGWGGDYRGDVMCEAHYKINGGISDERPGERFGNGNEACWDFWWSDASKNVDQETQSISKLTDTGYTVEYKIKATFNEIPAELRLHEGQVIGFGVKLYDSHRDDGQQNDIYVLEEKNDAMGGSPQHLSDLKLVANPSDDPTNPKDGDSIAVFVALLAVSAAGIAVVAKKKEF